MIVGVVFVTNVCTLLLLCECILIGSGVSVMLDIATELVFPGITFVGTVSHVTLPVRNQSAKAVSVVLCVDSVTVGNHIGGSEQCPFSVTSHTVLLNVASCCNIQVCLFLTQFY